MFSSNTHFFVFSNASFLFTQLTPLPPPHDVNTIYMQTITSFTPRNHAHRFGRSYRHLLTRLFLPIEATTSDIETCLCNCSSNQTRKWANCVIRIRKCEDSTKDRSVLFRGTHNTKSVVRNLCLGLHLEVDSERRWGSDRNGGNRAVGIRHLCTIGEILFHMHIRLSRKRVTFLLSYEHIMKRLVEIGSAIHYSCTGP